MIFRTVSTDPDHDEQAEDALFYRDALQELVQIGTDLARLLHQHAVAQAQAAVRDLTPCAPPTDHATAFDRIARAVRRTIVLARSLYEPVARALARTRAAFCKTTPPEAGEDAAGHPAAAAAAGRKDAEAPSADLRDRPEAPDRDAPDCDAPDRDDDDTGRPPAAVIADICRDLGLDTPPGAAAWMPRTPADHTPADTAQPCAQAAAPSGAAANGARQPGPGPQESWPVNIQPSLDPQPDEQEADLIPKIPRHPAQDHARWRPPLEA